MKNREILNRMDLLAGTADIAAIVLIYQASIAKEIYSLANHQESISTGLAKIKEMLDEHEQFSNDNCWSANPSHLLKLLNELIKIIQGQKADAHSLIAQMMSFETLEP